MKNKLKIGVADVLYDPEAEFVVRDNPPKSYADLLAKFRRERQTWPRAFLSYLITLPLFWVGCGLLLFALVAWVWG